MRVMSAIAFVASAYLAFVEVYAEVTEQAGDTELVFYFLAAAFLPKALQKFAEGSTGEPVEEDAESKKGWFTDENGNPSSVRFMALGALLMAIALATIEVHGWGIRARKERAGLVFPGGGVRTEGDTEVCRREEASVTRMWLLLPGRSGKE